MSWSCIDGAASAISSSKEGPRWGTGEVSDGRGAVGAVPSPNEDLGLQAAESNFDMLYGAPWLGCMCQWAAVAAKVGDIAAAASLYPKLYPWKHLFGTGGHRRERDFAENEWRPRRCCSALSRRP